MLLLLGASTRRDACPAPVTSHKATRCAPKTPAVPAHRPHQQRRLQATEQPRRGRARSPCRWNERNFTQDPQLHAPFATTRNDTPQLTPRQRQQVVVSAPAANC